MRTIVLEKGNAAAAPVSLSGGTEAVPRRTGHAAATAGAADTACRTVGVWCDSAAEIPALMSSMRDEGLAATSLVDGGWSTAVVSGIDAVVMRISMGLAEHLPAIRQIKSVWPLSPLLVACNSRRELDHVLALEVGADDVLDLDWTGAIAAARLRLHWKRAGKAHGTGRAVERIHLGSLVIDFKQRSVTLGGARVPLTEGEFEVLWLLAVNAGQPLQRREILRRLRGVDNPVIDRAVDSRVHRIKLKLGDTRLKQPRIRAVRNCGYVLSPSGW